MNKLVVSNEEIRMTSKELCELINVFRKEEGNETEKRHDVLMRDIRIELETLANAGIDDAHNFVLVNYTDAKGEKRPCYLLDESGVMQMLNKESAVVRYKTQQHIKALKEQLMVKTIEYDSKYGKYRLRKTFNESKDLRATYEEYSALSKIERDAHRINNKDRIRNCKAILDVISTRIASDITDMRASEVLALQELALDIQSDITRLHNKLNGGKKSAMTKRIQQLEEELSMDQDTDEDDYYFIDKSGISANYMYSYGKDKVVKSAAYHRWINNLHLEEYLPETYPGVDFNKPLRITILFGHKDTLDTNNLGKSIIDQIAEYYGFNDALVTETVLSLHSYVESHDDGYMYVKIENIDDTDED